MHPNPKVKLLFASEQCLAIDAYCVLAKFTIQPPKVYCKLKSCLNGKYKWTS